MKRRLLNPLTIVSLFMFEVVALLWLLRVQETYVLVNGVHDGGGGFAGGSYTALWALFVGNGRAGIGWTHSDVWFEHEASAPLWLLAVVTSAFSTFWLIRTVRRRQLGSDRVCRTCGYDLTGNVSGVCPECGGPTAAKQVQ